MNREIIITKDGSSSLLVKEMGETFHSRHGAVQESLHVYIENGIKKIGKNEISVLEFGFGTGLNALLTLQFAITHGKKICYETIEAYPLSPEEFNLLNYADFIKTPVSLKEMHLAEAGKPKEIYHGFTLCKHFEKIETFSASRKFDLVYFDVFGYEYQPELWSEEILRKAYDALNENGIFVTYACKSVVNRTLKKIGFTVHKVAGPPGKREMTVAVKIM